LSTVKKLGLNLGNQEDSTEFFGNLVEEIEGELKNPKGLNWRGKPGLRNLLWAGLTEFTVCKECKEQNWTNNSGTVVRLEIDQLGQGTSTIAEELHKVLHPRDKPSPCGQCKRTTNKSVSAPSQELSDYFCLNVPRKAWNSKTGKMERLKHKLRPEKVLSVKIGPKKAESLYSLTGGIVHLGEANSGHYLNILNISGVWFEVSDAKVKEITDSEALQNLESNGVLLLYMRSLSPKATETTKNEIKSASEPQTFIKTLDIAQKHAINKIKKSQSQVKGLKSNKKSLKVEPIFASNRRQTQLKEHIQAPPGRRKNENKTGKTEPLGGRQRFPQLKRTGKALKSRCSQWKKIYIPKGYYDPDRGCYYIPKLQN